MPLVLEQDLAASPNLIVSAVTDESGAYQWGATDVLRTTIENREGRFVLRSTVIDLASQRNRDHFRVDGTSSAGLLSSLNMLAKQLDTHATDFSTKNDRALEAFTMAVQSPNLQARAQMLGSAIGIDPTFGLAYLVLAETAAQTGVQNVPVVIEKARPHAPSFTPFDRARFEALAAQVSQSPLGVQEKADSLVLQFAPHNSNALAALGSVRFLENNANEGRRLYASALQISPSNANLRRQLATGLLETRQFADAEHIFAELAKSPAILPDLAVCILLEGDPVRAGSVFEKFLGSRPPTDPLTPLLHAEWLALSGEIPKAVQSLQAGNFSTSSVHALILSQITIWQLYAGDFSGAKMSARQAAQLDPQPTSFAALAGLLAASDEAEEQWRQQVSASPLNEQVKSSVLSYGFFLGRHFQRSAQVWQQAAQRSGDTDLRARAMLAASLDRAGERGKTGKVLVEAFIPDFGDLYSAVSFNEMHRLLGVR